MRFRGIDEGSTTFSRYDGENSESSRGSRDPSATSFTERWHRGATGARHEVRRRDGQIASGVGDAAGCGGRDAGDEYARVISKSVPKRR